MIYYLMGKSASGKDSLYKKLVENIPSINNLVIYTTRPIREGEKDGEEYHFVNKEFLDNNKNKIIEMRTYNTVYGPWSYATLDDGTIDHNKKYLMIGTLESYNKLKEHFGKENLTPLLIDVPNDIRYERAKKREIESKNPHFEEMERRFKADEIDFSKENIAASGIANNYSNIDFDKCLKDIINVINR